MSQLTFIIHSYLDAERRSIDMRDVLLQCVCSPAGLDLCTDIVLGRKSWEALFDPLNFFSLFKYVNPPPFPAYDLTVCVLCIDTALSLSLGIIL